MFIKSADELYGPMTTICVKGKIVRRIAWMAFEFIDEDWKCIEDAQGILMVCTNQLANNQLNPIKFLPGL